MKRNRVIGIVAGGFGLALGWTAWAEPESGSNRVRFADDLPEGVTVSEAGAWRVVHAGEGKATFVIGTVESPVIGAPMYILAGKVRYSDVQGKGYLEMWSQFAGDQAYFSRTVADRGPMRHVTGMSSWRDFILPFNKGEEPDPLRLVLNLVLEGPGEVEVKDLRLVAGSDWQAALHPDMWWGGGTSGAIGAFVGVMFGVLGSLVGWGRRDARRYGVAMAGTWIMIGVGAVCLVAGAAALFAGQPYHVSYLLGITAVIGLAVGGGVFRAVKALRTQEELRRMDASDVAAL